MAACIWCGENESTPLFERVDRLGEERFLYLRCQGCGLIRLFPQPSAEDMPRYYPPAYEAYQVPAENWLFRWGRRRQWVRRLEALQPYLPAAAGRVLDVGCAMGEYLELAQQRGWQVVGIEPDEGAARMARARLGVDSVQAVSLEDATFPAGWFDLITLWDVLEHLYDPVAALQQLAGWLRPGGVLALGVPNLDSWEAGWFGSDWIGWDAPRHRYLFPDDTLRAMLAALGLPVRGSCCCYGGYGALMLSLDWALGRRFGSCRAGRLLRWLAGWRLWRYVLWPYFRWAEWLDRGPIRSYFCRAAGSAPGEG